MKSMNYKYPLVFSALLPIFVVGLSVSFPIQSFSQDLSAQDPVAQEDDLFGFDDELDQQGAVGALQDSFRSEAFDKALNSLMPLNPDEIRTVLERFDRTVESTELPVHPYPRPESVVQNVSLDPGVPPLDIKMAFGYVTTISMVDSSGQPWPIEDISWVGDFLVQESTVNEFTHMIRISPEEKFAHGNISMRLAGLNAPVIMTLETNRDVVYYRFDGVIPKRGPGAKAPLIDPGVRLVSGDPGMSVALSGVLPEDADVLNVSGVNGQTSAYVYNGLVYLRTPLTLLSPAWDSSVSSADGMRVYALEETPVVLLSDRGRMVRVHLSAREELLDE